MVDAEETQVPQESPGVLPHEGRREQHRLVRAGGFGVGRAAREVEPAAELDAVAVANRPGLAGSLLVGLMAAKTLLPRLPSLPAAS